MDYSNVIEDKYIKEIWNCENFYISIYEFINDEIILKNANPTSLKFNNFLPNSLNKNIKEIYPPQNCSYIKKLLLKSNLQNTSYMRELTHNGCITLWNVKMYFKDKLLICIGNLISDEQLSDKKSFPFFSDCSLTLKVVDTSCYIIESFSDSIFKFTNKTFNVGDQLNYNILDDYELVHFLHMVKKCLELNAPIYWYQSFNSYDDSGFIISLLPINHNNCTKITAFIKPIDTITFKNFKETQRKDLNSYFDNKFIGFCLFSKGQLDDFEVEDFNQRFVEIFKGNDLKSIIEKIKSSKTFNNCLKCHNVLSEVFCLPNDDKKYILQAIPIVKNGIISSFNILTTIMAHNNIFKNTCTNLTKREQEVLSFVLDGYTNKYIAAKLNISEGTVKKLIYNSYKKLGVGSRVELIKKFGENFTGIF